MFAIFLLMILLVLWIIVPVFTTVTTVEIICFTVISPTNIGTSFPWPAIAYNGAVKLANSGYQEMELKITYVTDPSIGTCDDMTAIAAYNVSHQYYTRQFIPDMTVLIYTDNEQIELNRLAAEWNILMATTVAAIDTELQAAGMTPTWVSTSLLARDGLQDCLLKILTTFGWRTVSFVLDLAADPWFRVTRDVLFDVVHNHVTNGQPYKMEFTSANSSAEVSPTNLALNITPMLIDIQRVSRVVFYLGGTRSLRIMLTQASKMGMTYGDYVYMCVEPYPHPSWGNYSWQWHDDLDSLILEEAWRSVLILAMSSKELNRANLLEPYYSDWKRTAKDVYHFPLPDDADINFSQVMSFEGLLIFAELLHESLLEDPPPDLSDGAAFARRFCNRSVNIFTGSVNFNEMGVRLVDLVLKDYNTLSKAMEPALYYDSGNRSVKDLKKIDWPYRRSPPPNEPICGFSGRGTVECTIDTSSTRTTALSTTAALLIIFLVFAGVIRRSQILQQMSINRSWLLQTEELTNPLSLDFLTRSRVGSMTGARYPSNGSSMQLSTISSVVQNRGSMKLRTPKGHMIYRNRSVWSLAMNLPEKSVPETRKFIALCKMMHGLQHENINKFIGICLSPDRQSLLVIDEYCPKGSLRNILVEGGPLIKEFQKSFVQDLIQGLQYVHSSVFKKHGDLSSIQCLIDPRFVVKIAKLGFQTMTTLLQKVQIGRNMRRKTTVQTSEESLMWTAPELLNQTVLEPNPKTDIFSFGVILFEIYMISGLAATGAVLEADQHPKGISRFQSKVVPVEISAVVERCCCEDPLQRPTIETIRNVLFATLQIHARDNLVSRIFQRLELYANDLEKKVLDRTVALLEERKLCDSLLEEMLPRVIVEKLRTNGDVEPKIFDMVTIYFSDIDGFGAYALNATPYDVIIFLNNVYSTFDVIIPNFDVYKVETINDSYVVASGLPIPNGDRHAKEIALMALSLMRAFESSDFRGETQLRIGMHSGLIAAGVVGRKTPRYCLFGDTINTASRMESHGLAGKIHVSPYTAAFLLKDPQFRLVPRGNTAIKGKGEIKTFWLENAISGTIS